MTGLFPCPACQNPVSTGAAACPRCGHQFKSAGGINAKDPVHAIGLVLVAVFIIGIVAYAASAC